jgi:hypothetical protein
VTTPAKAWRQVGDQFETLGTRVRKHLDEVSTEAHAERVAFEKALRALISALEKGFGTAGQAVRDPAIREDIYDLAGSVREALLASFETAGDQVREHVPTPIAKPRRGGSAITHAPTRKAATKKTAARKATTHKPSPRKASATKSRN